MKRIFFWIILGFCAVLSLPAAALDVSLTPVTTLSLRCQLLSSNTVYVNADAATEGTGTKRSPIKTLSRLLTKLQSSSSVTRVCLTGIFSETLELSNIASTSLSFYGYGSSAEVGNGQWFGITNDSSRGNLTSLSITNIDITGTSAIGIWLRDLDTVTLNDIEIDGADTTAYGITFDTIGTAVVDDIIITDVTSDGINAYDGDDFTLTDFTITGDMTMALKLYDTDTVTVSRGSASGYTYYGISLSDIVAASVSGVELSSGGTSTYGVYAQVSSEALIYNNFIMGHYQGIRADGDTALFEFYNNSLSDNNFGIAADGISYVKNNILSSGTGQCGLIGTGASIFVSDYNLFDGDAGWDGSDCVTLSDWQALGYDANSLSGDPLFTSSSDLHLQATSPAIDVGTPLWTDLSDDIDGDARDASFDIGADEI